MAILTVNDLKAHVGIATSDSTDDTTLGSAVNAANRSVQRYCGRTFEVTTSGSESAREYQPNTWKLCYPHEFRTIVNLSVKTDDNDDGAFETTWAYGTDFILEPANGRLTDGTQVPYDTIRAIGSRTFPGGNDRPSVQVTAAWGWTAVPEDVFEAALIKAARVWKRKESPEGVVGGFQDFGAVRVSSREDPDVVNLLAPYRTAAAVLLVGL